MGAQAKNLLKTAKTYTRSCRNIRGGTAVMFACDGTGNLRYLFVTAKKKLFPGASRGPGYLSAGVLKNFIMFMIILTAMQIRHSFSNGVIRVM